MESTPSAGSEQAMLNGEPLTLSPTVVISDDDVHSMAPVIRSDGLILSMELTEEGRQKLRRVTGENIGRRRALILDGQLRSAPVIRDTIAGNSIQVPVQASEAEAEELLTKLRSRWPDTTGGEIGTTAPGSEDP